MFNYKFFDNLKTDNVSFLNVSLLNSSIFISIFFNNSSGLFSSTNNIYILPLFVNFSFA